MECVLCHTEHMQPWPHTHSDAQRESGSLESGAQQAGGVGGCLRGRDATDLDSKRGCENVHGRLTKRFGGNFWRVQRANFVRGYFAENNFETGISRLLGFPKLQVPHAHPDMQWCVRGHNS